MSMSNTTKWVKESVKSVSLSQHGIMKTSIADGGLKINRA